MQHKDQKIAIIGMGRSGVAAARLARREGAKVLCVDRNPNAPTPQGCHTLYGSDPTRALSEQDLIILSPGVPVTNPILNLAKENGVKLIGELGFASKFIHLPIVAITGTNGKSSTAWYTKQFLEQAGYKPFIGGNFGSSLNFASTMPNLFTELQNVIRISTYGLFITYFSFPLIMYKQYFTGPVTKKKYFL